MILSHAACMAKKSEERQKLLFERDTKLHIGLQLHLRTLWLQLLLEPDYSYNQIQLQVEVVATGFKLYLIISHLEWIKTTQMSTNVIISVCSSSSSGTQIPKTEGKFTLLIRIIMCSSIMTTSSLPVPLIYFLFFSSASSNCIENITLERGRSRHGNPTSENTQTLVVYGHPCYG